MSPSGVEVALQSRVTGYRDELVHIVDEVKESLKSFSCLQAVTSL